MTLTSRQVPDGPSELTRLQRENERLKAENAKIWADFDVLKATVLANERAKDAEIERLTAALKRITKTSYYEWEFRDGAVIGKIHIIARDALEQVALLRCNATEKQHGADLCPRCRENLRDKSFLGTRIEGHICGKCWQDDRAFDGRCT